MDSGESQEIIDLVSEVLRLGMAEFSKCIFDIPNCSEAPDYSRWKS